MSQREKMLALVVGGLMLLVVGYFGYTTYSGWLVTLRTEIGTLETQVSDKDAQVTRGLFAAKRLKELQARSLPADAEVARSLYTAWLLDLAEKQVKLTSPLVTPGVVTPTRNSYRRLAFTVSGRGTLEQLTRLLCAFYDAGYLHQIRSLGVKQVPESRLLEISLAVEALVLDGAAPASELAAVKSQQFAKQPIDETVQKILNRNVFGPANRPPSLARVSSQKVDADKTLSVKLQASDPDKDDKLSFRLGPGAPKGAEVSSVGELKFRSKDKGSFQVAVVVSDNGLPVKTATQTVSIEVPPAEKPKPRFEDGKFTFVTAIVEVAGERELWLTVRTSGEVLKLNEGDKFEVEKLKAVVERIGLTEIEVSSLGERRKFTIGDNLAEGAKLPAAARDE
jgi:hypothetical protein